MRSKIAFIPFALLILFAPQASAQKYVQRGYSTTGIREMGTVVFEGGITILNKDTASFQDWQLRNHLLTVQPSDGRHYAFDSLAHSWKPFGGGGSSGGSFPANGVLRPELKDTALALRSYTFLQDLRVSALDNTKLDKYTVGTANVQAGSNMLLSSPGWNRFDQTYSGAQLGITPDGSFSWKMVDYAVMRGLGPTQTYYYAHGQDEASVTVKTNALGSYQVDATKIALKTALNGGQVIGNNVSAAAGATAIGQSVTANGTNSFAGGVNAITTGDYAVSLGYGTIATGAASTALGNSNVSTGESSFSAGKGNSAAAFGEAAVGTYATTYVPTSGTAFAGDDRALTVGIGRGGSGDRSKNDGLIVYKDGTLEIDSLYTAPANSNNRIYTLKDSLYFQGTNLMRGGGSGGGGGASAAADVSYDNTNTPGLEGVGNVQAAIESLSGFDGLLVNGFGALSGDITDLKNGVQTESNSEISLSGNGRPGTPLQANLSIDAARVPYYPATGGGTNVAAALDALAASGGGSGGGGLFTVSVANSPSVSLYGDGTPGSPLTAYTAYLYGNQVGFDNSSYPNIVAGDVSGAIQNVYGQMVSGNFDKQTLSLSGNDLSILGGNTVTLPTNTATPQTLSIAGNALSISGGNSVTLPAAAGLFTVQGSTVAYSDIANLQRTLQAGKASFGNPASNLTEGDISFAAGYGLTSPSFSEVSVGLFNIPYTRIGRNYPADKDRVFSIGSGTSTGNHNVLTAFKNGTVQILGKTSPYIPNATEGIIYGKATGALQVDGDTSNALQVSAKGTGVPLSVHLAAQSGSGATYVEFGNLNGSNQYNQEGRIVSNAGSGVAYLTTSDQRLKTDKGTYKTGLSTLSKIKIHNYDWKINGTADVGVFAQELYKVYPRAVAPGDAGESIEKTWQVDYSKLVPVLISAIQELKEKVATLEAAAGK
jgi:hypothetical protein